MSELSAGETWPAFFILSNLHHTVELFCDIIYFWRGIPSMAVK